MSKLPKEYKFIDLSDYGRAPGRWIAKSLVQTSVTPIGVTTLFIIVGLLAIVAMLYNQFVLAAFLLILKSIIDAADGELARLKKTPSYTGRYYDSIADIVLNFFFLITFWHLTQDSIFYTFLAFLGIQLQGTVYNYYYVILRHSVQGDSTSRIFEDQIPIALSGEKQTTVNRLHQLHRLLYRVFDRVIYWMDKDAVHSKPFPKWFMTVISLYGLGFQLLLMAVMLLFQLQHYIIPFFITYSLLIFVFIGVRRAFLRTEKPRPQPL
ncbi:MAG TPA: CDP-alcohol phosphatidyltransferase family protein [Pelobium sp.]|nr:CDP-alcohol phosphatidyltransferase family protein [Pelobium sp.]